MYPDPEPVNESVNVKCFINDHTVALSTTKKNHQLVTGSCPKSALNVCYVILETSPNTASLAEMIETK